MHRSTTSNADWRLQTIVVVHGLWMTGAVFALQRAIREIPPKKRKLTLFGHLKRKLGSSESGA